MNSINIGSRVELMCDDYLMASLDGLTYELTAPVLRDIALRFDQPWEKDGTPGYCSAFKWNDAYYLYYRATGEAARSDLAEEQYLCLALSKDGIHWEKPSLGLYDFQGSTDNNILMSGPHCHNMTPVPDENPACPPEEKIKAVAGHGFGHGGLYLYASPDGLHFHKMSEEPVFTNGAFDSQNVLFYDTERGVYRLYSRYFEPSPESSTVTMDGLRGYRAIQSCESADCLHWSDPVPNSYINGTSLEHLYTNAVIPCPGAGHMLLSFPMRFNEDRVRGVVRGSKGISDGLFMTSRDGHVWDKRFRASFIDGGLDPRSWTQRCNMPVRGLLETSPEEYSFFAGKRYCWDDVHLARYTVRKFGFASLTAGDEPGLARTKPLIFSGSALRVNFASAAIGSLRLGLYDPETGRAYDGFALEDCAELFGNALDEEAVFRGGSLEKLSGKPVELRMAMRLCRLYSLRFA